MAPRQWMWIGVALGGVLGPLSCRSREPATAALAPVGVESGSRPRIVALGDSLTAGYGLQLGETYPELLQARLDREGYRFAVVQAGVSGDTSAGGLRRVEWALEGDVRALIVALGGNDALRGLPPDELKQNLSQIVARARGRHIAVLLAGMEAPPNLGPGYTTAFRQAFRDVAREHALVFVPFLLQGIAGVPALNQPDGIHPNAAGARLIVETLWPPLQALLDTIADP